MTDQPGFWLSGWTYGRMGANAGLLQSVTEQSSAERDFTGSNRFVVDRIVSANCLVRKHS